MRIFTSRPVMLAIAFLFTVSALPVIAQFPMAQGSTAERLQGESERDLEERIANMRYLAALAEKRGTGKRRDPKLALNLLLEDFTRIQIINKDLVLTTSKSNEIDFKFVAKSAGEINKRADRMLSNLALPEAETGTPRRPLEPISDTKQSKKAVIALGWMIYRFTKNPIFKEAKVIETAAGSKARRELEEIIELSLHLKKNAEQM